MKKNGFFLIIVNQEGGQILRKLNFRKEMNLRVVFFA
jgi:hypothetical protein